ncbi:MAG: pyruvate dehydrogenase (acetyl-transferring) E1 component subunit alpha [Desulfobacteraceae bacterium]|nr:MAG: pyruvate dehydrogenase (acetyl-transferring) E1 component subunit alpha [Desulfobacteraceae bacterium]
MPKTVLDIPFCKVEYLSILDEKGNLDKELEPDLPEEFLVRLYRAMLLGRRFDERLLNLQRQGRIGTFAPITGQEASQMGAVSVLEPTDWFVPSFREGAAELWRGVPMEAIVLHHGGFRHSEEGDEKGGGERSRNIPVAVPVGSQIIHAAGIGWAVKYRKEKDVVMTFFGDGATSEGDFHEGLNFAAVYKAPVVFVCQNNHWAISVPLEKQTRSKTLAQKAIAYGMPGIQVDGNDVLASYVAAKEAVERARSGEGPSMIECVTYRMMMHTTADDPTRYRKQEEVERWRERDPLIRFKKYLTDKGVADDKIDGLDGEVKAEVQAAVERAEKMMEKLRGEPIRMFDHIFADLPPTLKKHKEELARELSQVKEEAHG